MIIHFLSTIFFILPATRAGGARHAGRGTVSRVKVFSKCDGDVDKYPAGPRVTAGPGRGNRAPTRRP